MCLEISNGYLCRIPAMATRRDEFHFHVVCVLYEGLHGRGYFVIKDMFAGFDVGPLEA